MNQYKTAYIAGKITGVEFLNKPKFYAAEVLLRDLRFGRVLNPHQLCVGLDDNSPWWVYMKLGVRAVTESNEIYVLDTAIHRWFIRN